MTNSDDWRQITLLRDALDHIARIATAARQPTKRLDWIASRAKDALRGQDWSKDYLPEPQKQSVQEVHDLRATMFMLVQACEAGNDSGIAAAAEDARARHPSLFRRSQNDN
jgi:hypothetical protein